MMLDTPFPGDPMAVSPDRRRDAAAGSDHDPLDFGVPVKVDVFGVSDVGHVRATNEDHFLIARVGRYFETIGTSLPSASTARASSTRGISDGSTSGGRCTSSAASRT